MIGEEYYKKFDPKYVNRKKINEKINRACNTLKENSLITGCDVQLISSAELDCLIWLMNRSYLGYGHFLVEGETLRVKITRI